MRQAADPDQALLGLERWLAATGSPGLYASDLAVRPDAATRLARVLGASGPLLETVVQNPELASVVTDAVTEDWDTEGERLLRSATGHRHRLDRLRYLRQRAMLQIVAADLDDRSQPERTWARLSDLADALLRLAYGVAGLERGSTPPVAVVAFGKLGGRELNLSSDLDLAYVVPDGLTELEEREAMRFAEGLGRTLSERMGRGLLYRVDLRLRPYGSTGPLVNSISAVRAYYERYAEPWEWLALIRSRVVGGPDELGHEWESLREQHAFRERVAEGTLDDLRALRFRMESEAPADDIKRGAGGIRDPEFAAQLGQIVHGREATELRQAATLDALSALGARGYVAEEEVLASGYRDLRRLEHFLQLRQEQQTHRLPTNPREAEVIARLMGWPDLKPLASLRAGVRRAYLASVPQGELDSRTQTMASDPELGPWFDRLPQAELFYRQLQENRDSRKAAGRIARLAPRLATRLAEDVAATEAVLSGEVEEPVMEGPWPATATARATRYKTARLGVLSRFVLHKESVESDLHALRLSLISTVAEPVAASFIGLGSLGTGLTSPASDSDLVIVAERGDRDEAEGAAHRFLRACAELDRYGCELRLDLRLRPDGGKGLLVRTPEALQAYARDGMEPWERYALGHLRPVLLRQPSHLDVLWEMAYGPGLSEAEVASLREIKGRIEQERVKPGQEARDVKLGRGGLLDVEWTVHGLEMRYANATGPEPGKPFAERIASLARAGLLNWVEVEMLKECHRWLLDLRTAVWLQGVDNDVLPENPDRLDRIAGLLDQNDGNAVLARHADVTATVRRLYDFAWELLQR